MRRGPLALGLLCVLLAAGLLWQYVRGCQPAPVVAPSGRPNVIVIVVDTLRGDMLAGPQGEPAEMPFARELARRGVLFTDVTSAAPWTIPSMASLLTGVLPPDHGCMRMVSAPRLPAALATWAEAFGRAGYSRAAYSGALWALHGEDGLLRGFSAGRDSFGLDRAARTLQPWRRSLAPGRPFFLLLHSFEAHDPYGPENNRYRVGAQPEAEGFDASAAREPWEWARHFMLSRPHRAALERAHGPAFQSTVMRYLWSGYREEPRPALAEELKQAYVAGVRWVDGLLRETVAWLQGEGLLENTFLVITSDHGEAFGEHGTLEHGRILHQEVLHVPLVVVGPGAWGGGKVITRHVPLMDLMPTLAEAAGVLAPPGTVGRSLAPLLAGEDADRTALSFDFVNFDVAREDLELQLRSARTGRHAVLLEWDVRRNRLREQAYDRQADRVERNDLAGGRGSLEGLSLDPQACEALDGLRAGLVADGMGAPVPPPCAGSGAGRGEDARRRAGLGWRAVPGTGMLCAGCGASV
ncbi:MAG: sulfatase, partial [Planctomycetia bacterium]